MSPEDKPEPRELFNCVQRTRLSHWIHQESSGNDFWLHASFAQQCWELHNYGKSECHQRTSPNPGNCSTVSKEHVCHIGFTRRAQEMISDCTQVLRQQFEKLHNYGKSECHQRTSPNPGNCSTVSKEHVCHIGFTRRAQEMISDCMQVLTTMLRTA